MEDEVHPKKLPRLRKVNFTLLEESILQRKVEFFFNAVTNLEKARIWSEITSKTNASNSISFINKTCLSS
jgi:hypothetical protein